MGDARARGSARAREIWRETRAFAKGMRAGSARWMSDSNDSMRA